MPAVLLLALVASTPVKVGAAPWQTLNVPSSEADYYLEFVTQRLARGDLQVTTPSEIAALLGMERQKELLGCGADSGQCMAELASALGVDSILQGSIGRFGSKYEISLKVVSAKNALVIARFAESVNGQEQVTEALARAALELRRALVPEASHAGTASSGLSPRWALAPALIGAVLVASGAVLWAISNGRVAALDSFDRTRVGADPDAFAAAARSERGAGISLVVSGSAAAVAALIWFFVQRSGSSP